jgi:hypothetical protein
MELGLAGANRASPSGGDTLDDGCAGAAGARAGSAAPSAAGCPAARPAGWSLANSVETAACGDIT